MSDTEAPPVEEQPGTPPDAPPPEEPDTGTDTSTSTEDDEFRAQQKSQAESQNQTADNAVPEQRPQAFQQVATPASPLTQRLIDEEAIPDPQAPPMGRAAYDAANDEQRKQETAANGLKPAVHEGLVIAVTSGPHRDRRAAVLRVINYVSPEDQLARVQGGADARFAQPKEVEVSFRGDDRDGERAVLDLEDVEYDIVPGGFSGRAAVSGSL